MNKTQSLRVHTKRRAKERFGMELNRSDLKEIVNIIQRGRTVCSGVKLTNARIVHLVRYQETLLPVIYDKHRHEIITVLPSAAISNYFEED